MYHDIGEIDGVSFWDNRSQGPCNERITFCDICWFWEIDSHFF